MIQIFLTNFVYPFFKGSEKREEKNDDALLSGHTRIYRLVGLFLWCCVLVLAPGCWYGEQFTVSHYPIVSLCVTTCSQVTAWWRAGSINGFGLFCWLTSYSPPFLHTCGRFLKGKGWINCSTKVSQSTTWPSSSQIILTGTQIMRQLVSSYVKFLPWVHL